MGTRLIVVLDQQLEEIAIDFNIVLIRVDSPDGSQMVQILDKPRETIDQKQLSFLINGTKIWPHVMVGHGKKSAEPRQQYRYAYRRDAKGFEEETVQQAISWRIHDFLKNDIEEEQSVRINISCAWTRWAHPDHLDAVGELAEVMRERFPDEPTIENLEYWVR